MLASARLREAFAKPRADFTPVPTWWWTGATLTRPRLTAQMDAMIDAGIRQAVVMSLAPGARLFGARADDPPYRSDAWWTVVDGVCQDAATRGFGLWIYDQIGFSGSNVQGRLIHEDSARAGLALRRTVVDHDDGCTTITCPDGDHPLWAYAQLGAGRGTRVVLDVRSGEVSWDGPAARVVMIHATPTGFDYLSPEAGAALIADVHEEFARRAGHWFGGVIRGFFQDELPAMPTWSRSFAATFLATYGYDLVPRLPALWDEGPDGATVRRDFQEHRARLARTAFFDPVADWFESHGLVCGFDQPTPAREGDPAGSVQMYGDYLGSHERFGAPGNDHWGDSKVHSSLAHANGHQRTWIEAFHSTGWGGTLEETYDWLAPFLRRGATLYNPHAVYYATNDGWWEWAAPSTCWRQPYWPDYDIFSSAVTRLCSVLSEGTHVCDTVLVFPTTTAQAYVTQTGRLPAAARAGEVYRALNGDNGWVAERRGILDRRGVDYDVLDEETVARGSTDGGFLAVGSETYRNVVLPAAVAVHPAAALRLVALARSGGRVVCVAPEPAEFLGGTSALRTMAANQWAQARADGLIIEVSAPEDVPQHLHSGAVTISADAPHLLRRVDDVHVLALFAHDDVSGTRQPIIEWFGAAGADHGLDWSRFWSDLRTEGYTFVPAGDRVATVRIAGLGNVRVQQWDPRSGQSTELEVERAEDGVVVHVPFHHGLISVLVVGQDLPPADRSTLGPASVVADLRGPWRLRAESTVNLARDDELDVGPAPGTPLAVWTFDHRVVGSGGGDPGGAGRWRPAVATYGPFALVAGPVPDQADLDGATRSSAEWSLARGIRKDPIHHDVLGPKGRVPEEFLHWDWVPAGSWVSVQTALDLGGDTGRTIAVGANAHRRVTVDGGEVPVDGEGHLTLSAVPSPDVARSAWVEFRFRADRDGPLRAFFAVVADPVNFARPEWIQAPGPGRPGRVVELASTVTLDAIPADGRILLGGDGPAALSVNGIRLGRQGGFQPFPQVREVRAHVYDLTSVLHVGTNTITIEVIDQEDGPTAAFVDSMPTRRGGLGLLSGRGWTATSAAGRTPASLTRRHPGDPGFACLWPRAHPLPFASSADGIDRPAGVVLPAVPDLGGPDRRTEVLRFRVPLGTVRLRVPTSLPFSVRVDGASLGVTDGWVALPEPAGVDTWADVEVLAAGGRRGGALLDGPIAVETAEADGPLASWEDLGWGGLAGAVTYRTQADLRSVPSGAHLELDLGHVRGTAEVRINGRMAGRLAWGPWVLDLTGLLRLGWNDIEIVVRGTLAGYLDEASPTPAVYRGQTRCGLFGPVRVLSRPSASGRPAR